MLRGHVDETADGCNKDDPFVELDTIFSGPLGSLILRNGGREAEPMSSECTSEEQRGNEVDVKHLVQIGFEER